MVGESMQLGPRNTGTPPTTSSEDNQASPPTPASGLGLEKLETVEYPEDDIRPEDIQF